ncbi:MAG: COX15/CtaA family protein [Candidatus Planktophila sp.]|jgi:heme a synthase|nr:COX15/CtaA family protein [Candidatus Planktophila sp.]
MKLRRFLYGALLTLQAGLVLTGGAVRITGSGLGCPTWPECTPGSYTPVPHQAEGQLHAWIEFGNRLLTFALVAVALAVLINVLYRGRRDLRSLALGQVLGILGQGILGGITVLTDLHPLPVAGHLLLSIILIAGAASLYSRREYSARPRTDLDKLTKRVSVLHIGLTFVVIILGTIVTGSGPHAGDEKAQRFGFDIRTVSWLHADAVIALIGLTAAYYILVRNDPKLLRRVQVFLVVALAQGAIGYIQYFTGIPEILVAAHLLGATLVWITAWRIRITVTRSLIVN